MLSVLSVPRPPAPLRRRPSRQGAGARRAARGAVGPGGSAPRPCRQRCCAAAWSCWSRRVSPGPVWGAGRGAPRHGSTDSIPIPVAGRGKAPPGLQRGRVGPRAAGAARRRKRAPEPGRNKATVKGRVVKSAIGESRPFHSPRTGDPRGVPQPRCRWLYLYPSHPIHVLLVSLILNTASFVSAPLSLSYRGVFLQGLC